MEKGYKNRKIKILVDAHIFDHSYQGTATYIKGLYNALVRYKDIEIVLCACDTERLKEHFPDPAFRFIQLTSHSRIKRLAIEYPRIIKSEKFDFAHFQYIVPLFKGTKFINTIHDLLFIEFPQYFPWTYRFVKGILFRFSALRSDLVLTVSEYSKQALINFYRISNDRILVTPNAVSPGKSVESIKTKYGLEKYLLYVSRFEPRKNHRGLLKAFLELNLSAQGYQLVFIGSKKESIELEAYQQLKNLIPSELKESVKFYEDISSNELSGFYKETSCFVFPSLAEGFGIPPIEAGLNECKVLCSNTTAMKDFNFFKYRFNPADHEDFKIKLKEILSDQNYPYLEIKEIIQGNYNWDKIASALYERLTSE